MKKISSLRQLQNVGIYIYRDLLDVCIKNGLHLYLTGGTLLGAVRHKGFIPWDDDIDVCMSRPDYNKLIELTKGRISEKCSLIDPETTPSYKGVVPVVVYNNSSLVSKQFRELEQTKIGISVFVYDGVPLNAIHRILYYARMYILRAKHALCRADFKNVNTTIARIVGPILSPFFSSKKILKYKKRILKLQKKYRYEISNLVSTNVDYASSKEVFPKAEFESAAEILFEEITSYTFSYYVRHLTRYYGEYMTLPPKEKQNPKHGFDAEIEEEFHFDDYVRKNNGCE